ncbi:MAG: hemolysin family protein [Endomicrobium sp.]|jgi:CBS domain containing-hemolysin-like protein|nr:hemolysin family protein [Endomicrobium sp.]
MIEIIIKIILFIILLAALGFFNAAETALTSLSGVYLRRLKENHSKYRACVLYWETNTGELMTAMIIGMNLSIVGIGVIVSSLSFDISKTYGFRYDVFAVAASAATIILALIIGNIFPKTFARYNAEKVGAAVLPSIIVFGKFFKHVIKFLIAISNRILKIFVKKKESRSVEAEEIDFLISNERTSPLAYDAREIAGNIMDFAKTRISQVMVPRHEIFAVDIEDKKEDVISAIIEQKFSRVPVYKGDLNNIIGIIYSKDLAVAWRSSDIIVLEDLIRPAYYVPESAKIDKMLKEFRTGRQHIAIVVDEFGSTIGIASIEDLLEEIVGEVWDEYDMMEKTILPYGDNAWLVQSYEMVANLNEELNAAIPEDDYSTVNGWVLELFGKIPQTGEKIKWNNYEIEVQDADKKKVNRIILRLQNLK